MYCCCLLLIEFTQLYQQLLYLHCRKCQRNSTEKQGLTYRGQEAYICVSKLTIIGSVNGLSPRRCQAIACTNAPLLPIRPQGTCYFIEFLFKIQKFWLMEIHLKMSSAKWRPFWLGLNVLIDHTHPLSINHITTAKQNKTVMYVQEICCISDITSKYAIIPPATEARNVVMADLMQSKGTDNQNEAI